MLPPPTFDGGGNVNTLYVIAFPSGYPIQNAGTTSCVQFCAYHGTNVIGGKSVPYAVLPFLGPSSACNGGCGAATNWLDNLGSNASHQLIEAITDPEIQLATVVGAPMAWFSNGGSSCGEIGDICGAQQTTLGAYTVQKEWSNKAMACVAQSATMPAICTAPNTPAGCRGCTKSDNGAGCSGGTSACDTNPTSTTYGRCVAAPVADAGADAGGNEGGTTDSGPRDSGATDSSAPSSDSGSSADAGGNAATDGGSSGCGCRVSGEGGRTTGGLGAALALVAFIARRRRSRAAP